MTIEAPCPDAGEAACAASPMMITWSKDWIRKVAEAVERDPPV
jgi:hypothetical protein